MVVSNLQLTNRKEKLHSLLTSNLDFDSNWRNDEPRHYLHAFPAKFPPSLPKFFIENLTKENDIVLDPMAGSVTTLIEASLLNREAIGFDIDPLSLLIGKAKLQNYVIESIYSESISLLNRAINKFQNHTSDLKNSFNEKFDKETLEFLNYWFPEESQLQLMALKNEIEQLNDTTLQCFLQLVFSGIIVTKSGGITYARDLAHTRPHKVADKKINTAFGEFKKRIKQLIAKITTKLESDVSLREGNAKSLPLQDNSIDLIITSPPYANNAIDYMRAHKFSLIWFGYKISDLRKIRKSFLGSETLNGHSLSDMPELSKTMVNSLSVVNKSKGRALHRYYNEMQKVITEMHRVLKPQSAAIIVVATSQLANIDVKTHECLAEIGREAGFELIKIGERKINRNRRMLPLSNKKSTSSIENRMHNEYVVGLWKS